MTTEQLLRDAYQRAVDARRGDMRGDCVPAEALLDLVRRDGPEATRLATLDHVMACAPCREEFELLRSIERAGGAGIAEAVDRLRWRRYASIAAAASVVLAVAIGPGRRLISRDAPPMRGGEVRIETVAPAAGATVSDRTARFVWRAVPGAHRYVLELLDGGGMVALTRETTDTALTVTLDPAIPAGDYTWWVRAATATGATPRSAARALSVRP